MSVALAEEIARAGIVRTADGASILCAIVLRGGLLLYPGFCGAFSGADFCLLGMKRGDDGVVACPYLTQPVRASYDVGIYVDCVAATGGTLLEARRVLASTCDISRHVAAVLCSSDCATGVLVREGIDVVGFRLSESLDGDIVTPDMGEMDAGDLFSGVSQTARALAG
ncbi:MAG TPA: hypothetical protein VHJ34_12355 [Actinomycetota bacterium]|nr:hypothetical protein [Actinomycetota bacterium]